MGPTVSADRFAAPVPPLNATHPEPASRLSTVLPVDQISAALADVATGHQPGSAMRDRLI